jgi:hypothetical protein
MVPSINARDMSNLLDSLVLQAIRPTTTSHSDISTGDRVASGVEAMIREAVETDITADRSKDQTG